MRGSMVALVGSAAFVVACMGPREAGRDKDFGKTLFWEVLDLDSGNVGCTDDPGFQDALQAPPLEAGTFFVYALSDDGKTAVAQDCTETRAASCSDASEITFEVDGTEMLYVAEPVRVEASRLCDVELTEMWRFVDGGEDATLDATIAFDFLGVPNACDELEASLVEASNNGLGLSTCEIQVNAELAFVIADQ